MPRIPRTEQTVDYSPRPQPFSEGDGYAAPGKAMVQLGKGISSLGDAFDSIAADASREAEKKAEYEYQTAKSDLAYQEHQTLDQKMYEYPQTGGDGSRFTQEWGDEFLQRGTQWAERWKGTKHEQRAALDVRQLRNHYAPKALNFQQSAMTQHTIGLVDKNLTGATSVVTADPSSIDAALAISEGAIRNAPGLSFEQQNAMRKKAADLAFDVWIQKAEKDLSAEQLEGAKKAWEEKAKAYRPAPEGVPGPQSGLPDLGIRDFTSKPGRGFAKLEKPTHIVLHDVSGSDPARKRLPQGGNIPNYHITFDKSGINLEVPFERQAPHAMSFNKHSIGISHIGYEGDKLDPAAIKNGARAVLMVQEKFGIPAQNILTHPEGGSRATGSGGKDPREAVWRKDVLAYIDANRQALLAEIRGGGAQPGAVATAGAITPNLTAYAPVGSGPRQTMEGGYAAARPGPDGKAEVRTLADVAAGRAQYVTIAGNPRDYGKTFTIPKIAFVDAKGETRELTNVKAVVHDTGSAFKNAPEGRYDVAIDRDASDAQMAKSHTLWKQTGVQFVPEGQGQGRPTREDLKGRSLVAAAGNQAAREANTVPGTGDGEPSTGELKYADAGGGNVVPFVGGGSRTTTDYMMREFQERAKKIDAVLEAKQKAEAAEAFVVGAMQGKVPFNPYNTEEKKIVDEYFSERSAFGKRIYGGDLEALNRGVVIAQEMRYAPKSVYQALQGLANAKEPEKKIAGYTALNNLIESAPNILDQHDGNAKLVEKAQLYATLRGMAYEPSEALAKMAEMATPEYDKRMKDQKEKVGAFVKGLSLSDMKNTVFDPGAMSWEPNAASDWKGVGRELMGDYTRLAEEAFLKFGDEEMAKKFAAHRLKAVYGTTYVNGSASQGDLIKYPPERFFTGPGGQSASPLIREQMVADVKSHVARMYMDDSRGGTAPDDARARLAEVAKKVPVDESAIFIKADTMTERHIAAKGQPTYQLWYVNKNGLPEAVMDQNWNIRRWHPDLTGAAAKAKKTFEDKRAVDLPAALAKPDPAAAIATEAERRKKQTEPSVPSWQRGDNSIPRN
jgi:hypothetical protein